MRRLILLPLLLLASGAALAQPSAERILSEWRAGWDRAAAGVDAVEVRETLDRTVDGPREDIEMRTEGRIVYASGAAPRRTVDRAELDGRRVAAPGRARFERRTRRAFGVAADILRIPPPLPGTYLRGAEPTGRPVRDDADGRPAWRVPLSTTQNEGRVTAWFGRSEGYPLLRLQVERERDGARATLTADYRRVRGLDLPTDLSTTVTVRQRRRLRTYAVDLRARGTYRSPEIVR